MLPATMSKSTSISEEASVCSGGAIPHSYGSLSSLFPPSSNDSQPQLKTKKKRNQPGNPDPDAQVVALSPRTLLATNRFVCEICGKGFQRDQNLQLHRRGHNLPWKLRQRSGKENAEKKKKVYVCPEESCIHHHPSRALGDLTGIKKHFCRKHGEKKWKCERCSKRYAVMSDWKAHAKTCGTREYRCNCGTIFSRKDSFVTHRAFCDALAEESARLNAAATTFTTLHHHHNPHPPQVYVRTEVPPPIFLCHHHLPSCTSAAPATPHLSATALLQKAAAVGHLASATAGTSCSSTHSGDGSNLCAWPGGSCLLTRDFLGMAGGPAEGLLSLAGGGLGLMDTPGTSSAPTASLVGPPMPDPTVGFGFHHQHSAAAVAPHPWGRLLG